MPVTHTFYVRLKSETGEVENVTNFGVVLSYARSSVIDAQGSFAETTFSYAEASPIISSGSIPIDNISFGSIYLGRTWWIRTDIPIAVTTSMTEIGATSGS